MQRNFAGTDPSIPMTVMRVLVLLLVLSLTACAPGIPSEDIVALKSAVSAGLPDLGPAPELGNSIWLNTESPLRLADLRGKVVGLEMWTFGCINCQNVIPYLKQWHAAYRDEGLVLIGNHFPEFSFERNLDNPERAVQEAGIEYVVTQDNDGATWNAYGNRYWPTLYLIDKRGRIRYVHIGEGAYDEIERNMRTLLAETYP